MTDNGACRVSGPRREEVAVLAGVNADCYARLEQGRERRPSAQLLDALGRAGTVPARLPPRHRVLGRIRSRVGRMTLDMQMITVDCADPRRLAAWWADALDAAIDQDFGGEFVIVGAKPLVLGFQKVPEPRQGKNRVHVDFHTEDRHAEVARLVASGATVVGEHSVGPLTWTVLQDPEGNEFCVAG